MKNSRWRFPIVLFALNLFLPISSPAQNHTSSASSALTKDSVRLARTVQEYWEYPLTDTFYARYLAGEPLNDLPDISEAKAKSDAAFARRILRKLHSVNQTKLSHDDLLTLEVLRWQAELELGFAKYYWFDFQITAHASPLPLVQRILERRQFHTKEDLDSYLRLLEQLKVFIVQTRMQAAGQMQRGIVLPKTGIPGAKAFLVSYLQEEDKSPFFVAQERLKAIDPALAGPFQEKIRNVIQAEINPELRGLVDYVGGDYARKAPDAVGMQQYRGGKQYYRFMVRAYTTLEISPEELYRIGVESVEHDEAQMTELLSRIGFKGMRKEFREFLLTDPRFIAKKPEEIQERLMSYVRSIEPNIASYFLHIPKAGYTIRRLDPGLEGAYAFGFYVEPSVGQPLGIFFFNGSQLNERSMYRAGPLILHELVPGHHFQLNLTSENHSLPEFRRYAPFPAYSEGWADYSSQLGSDMGAYRDDYDRYALLAQNMHQSVRLVVDTGLNYLGWSLEHATNYMREHELESETQIKTELLRYTTGTPAQALAYKMGSHEILTLREKAQKELGNKFDIREFHDWILGSGPLPLKVLAQHVDWCIEQAKKKAGLANGHSSSPMLPESASPVAPR
jgi:uncharacterized protein (DUF885 family)